MRVSVVIPTLNEAERLPRLLEDLRPLDLTEIVVSDGGSEDGTPEVAAAAGARVVRGARGRGAQLRAGAAAAEGDVLWFLHADVRVPPGCLPALRTALRTPAVVGGAFTLHTIDDGGRRWGWVLRLADLRSRLTRLPYGDQGLFVRRAAYVEAGGFPEQPLMEDLALSLALSARGRLVTLGPSVLASGRRFGHRPLRAAVCMWTFPTLWRLGVAPETLARWYRDVR